MSIGILGSEAPELRVSYWIDERGRERKSLRLGDLGSGLKVLFCFQDWCPGCHSVGFPALRAMVRGLAGRNVGFAAIQTVFEGEEINTSDKLVVNRERYGLMIPFGHDVAIGEDRYPVMITDYRTGGTPWFIVIDAGGRVILNDFTLDAEGFVASMQEIRAT